MQSKDHVILGSFLLEKFRESLSPLKKALFLFGCVEPDLNPTTYLRGSRKNEFLRGHNAENAKEHTEKLVEKLLESGVETPAEWFRLGTALHYTADAFTFPHNSFFAGTLKEHIEYESIFHPIFVDFLKSSPRTEESEMPNEDGLHRRYVSAGRSFLTDCRYILRATEEVFRKARYANASAEEPKRLERGNSYA